MKKKHVLNLSNSFIYSELEYTLPLGDATNKMRG